MSLMGFGLICTHLVSILPQVGIKVGPVGIFSHDNMARTLTNRGVLQDFSSFGVKAFLTA